MELPHPHRRHRGGHRGLARCRAPAQHPGHRSPRAGGGGTLGPGGAASPGSGPSDTPPGPPPTTGVVAVATGDGIGRIFRSLGVHRLIAGGQSMNPSTAELLEAVESVRLRLGHHPAQQQEHPAGGRTGQRADRQVGPGRPHRHHRRGVRRPAGLRPGGRRRRQRRDHGGLRPQGGGRRGHPGGPGHGQRRRSDRAGDWLGLSRQRDRGGGRLAGRRGLRPARRPGGRRATTW